MGGWGSWWSKCNGHAVGGGSDGHIQSLSDAITVDICVTQYVCILLSLNCGI